MPLLSDKRARQPKVGEHTLSKVAIDARAGRVFSLRTSGQKKVSQNMWDEWRTGNGSKEREREGERAKFEQIFARCGCSHGHGLAVNVGEYGSRVFHFQTFKLPRLGIYIESTGSHGRPRFL